MLPADKLRKRLELQLRAKTCCPPAVHQMLLDFFSLPLPTTPSSPAVSSQRRSLNTLDSRHLFSAALIAAGGQRSTPLMSLCLKPVQRTSETMRLYVILCGVFHVSAVIQSAAVKQDAGVVSVSVGDNVTLRCFYDSQVAMHFSWYRQTLGGGPELLSNIYKHDKPSKVFHWMQKNPRFSVQRKEGVNHLHISDVHFSDSATYFCGSSHSNTLEFGEGVFLNVKGAKLKEIVQGPVSKTIQPGGSVTLDCTVHTGTCDGEHSVYWFRHESRQGILHVQGDRRKHVSASGSRSQSCVYHLQKMNLSSSDSGTYYCAVASCGEILFGNGSKVLVKGDADDPVAQMRILFWLSVSRTGILLFFVIICLLVYISKRR